MTETRLRTRIHCLAYGFCAAVFALLAYLNLLYGFYSFFYGALVLIILAAGGIVCARWIRQRQLQAAGHGVILAAMTLTVLVLNLKLPQLGIFWIFPLILLDLLILPLRRGLILAASGIVLLGLAMLINVEGLLAVAGLLSALQLGALAALFAYRYHHHVRSVGELTTTDPVTGAFNTRFFDETLRREVSRSETTGHPLSLLHLAIDYYGELEELHHGGELHPLLGRTSETLRQTIRAGDSHYYLGHGEFLLLLPFTPEEGVRVIAERIRRVIAERHWPVVESMTVSLGGVSWHVGGGRPEMLADNARTALAEARKRGHNQTYHLQSQAADAKPGTAGSD